jgi:hypothetical protein
MIEADLAAKEPSQEAEAEAEAETEWKMAKGTGALYTWMFNETSIDAFDHIQLVNVGLTMKRGRGDGSDGAYLLKGVTAKIPLGKLYVISGELPQFGKGVGRGTVLEALCGLRLVDEGFLGLPPHLKCVMLTENTTGFFDKTVEESLLWGHPNPASVKVSHGDERRRPNDVWIEVLLLQLVENEKCFSWIGSSKAKLP